jgi:hypothetical protein
MVATGGFRPGAKDTIHGDPITLAHAPEEAGQPGSGGQAKDVVREDTVRGNGGATQG